VDLNELSTQSVPNQTASLNQVGSADKKVSSDFKRAHNDWGNLTPALGEKTQQ
jgi:hypothetical protein